MRSRGHMVLSLALASLVASSSMRGGRDDPFPRAVDPPPPPPPQPPRDTSYPRERNERTDSVYERKQRKRQKAVERSRIKAGIPGSKLARKAASGKL